MNRGITFRCDAASTKEALARTFSLMSDFPDGELGSFTVSILHDSPSPTTDTCYPMTKPEELNRQDQINELES